MLLLIANDVHKARQLILLTLTVIYMTVLDDIRICYNFLISMENDISTNCLQVFRFNYLSENL